jgi:opacity protein-like surface antigen
MSGFRNTALAGLLAISVASPAMAADMLKYSYQAPPDLEQAPVEIGSGWYLRADVGWSKDKGGQLSPDIAMALTQNSWQADVGAGFKWNSWFRSELMFGFHKMQNFNSTGAKVTCPYQLTGLSVTDPATNKTTEIGYLWDSQKETCSPVQSANLRRQELMLNSFVDLGTWGGITPYVGAGVGVAALTTKGSLQYYKTSDGSAYSADLTPIGTFPHIWLDGAGNQISPQPAVSYAKQDWTKRLKQTSYNFAWALMAGVGIDLTPRAKLDIGYRFANLGKYTSLVSPVTGQTVTTTLRTQEVHVGMRYLID